MMLKLTKQLFPTGRAFKIPQGGKLEKILYALTLSESRYHLDLIGILDLILPDNTNFTTTEASLWEARLGLTVNPTGFTLAERMLLIKRKYNHPGTIIPRQNYRYLEKELQDAGFNVYVHEILSDPASWTLQHALDNEHGLETEMGAFAYDVIANSIDRNETYDVGYGYTGLFFIGGQNFPDIANISESKLTEFRRLVLKIKPVNTIAVLLINFNIEMEYMDGDVIELMDGDSLETMN